MGDTTQLVRVLGIRHHGPGSARAVELALREIRPDCILIEGPAELTEVVALASSPDLQPPIAGFVYLEASPQFAVFDPFAVYSPEWVALRHGVDTGVPVRFIDLPAAHELTERASGLARAEIDVVIDDAHENHADENGEDDTRPNLTAGADEPSSGSTSGVPLSEQVRRDPIGALARLGGYEDGESWWDDVIEHQLPVPNTNNEFNPFALFDMISEAMRELRSVVDAELRIEGSPAYKDYERNERREAAMRTALRSALTEGHLRIAVVCGAWHAPALNLETAPRASADTARLRGLNKAKTTATWVPWTHRRLEFASGYGAGVTSPGWYHHIFTNGHQGPDRVIASWLVKVARVLRSEGLDASPASVIEALRMSNALAALRGRPIAGLGELDDTVLSVLAGGSETIASLVRQKLAVGDLLGSVPEDTPMVPLARDLAQQQKKLRIKVGPVEEQIDLDLRKPADLAKSHLLHRLTLLDIDWGLRKDRDGRTTGTFHEVWTLCWRPELAVALVEASLHGTTVEAASSALTIERARSANLRELTQQIERALLAELPLAIESVLTELRERAALSTDVGALMDSVAPLARVARYGDVRRTDATAVRSVLDGLMVRICSGLGGACASLDDDAAEVFLERINTVHAAVGLVDDEERRAAWSRALERLSHQDSVHGLVSGRVVRILTDSGVIDKHQTATALSLALSRGAAPERSAAWVEGFLSGSALLLLHDPEMLRMIDEWVASVDTSVFDDLIPLLRRTFATLTKMERRLIGNAVIELTGAPSTALGQVTALNTERANLVIPKFLQILGVERV